MLFKALVSTVQKYMYDCSGNYLQYHRSKKNKQQPDDFSINGYSGFDENFVDRHYKHRS